MCGSVGHAVSEENTFYKSTNQKQELPVAVMFVSGSGRNEQSLLMIFHRCFLQSVSFGHAVSEEIFLEINQSEIKITCGGHV